MLLGSALSTTRLRSNLQIPAAIMHHIVLLYNDCNDTKFGALLELTHRDIVGVCNHLN
jgi:hypothetical protein